MDGIPDHLCLQPVEREPPVVIVVGIDGTDWEFRPSVRCHLVGLGGDHESVHAFHAVATADKFRGQPIQKIPMQGQGALSAEIAGLFVQSRAEMPLPQTIDGNASKQWVLRCSQPVCESLMRPSRISIGPSAKGHPGFTARLSSGRLGSALVSM